MQQIIVTGGAGFIGANYIHHLFADPSFTGKVLNIDALTYAGNLESLKISRPDLAAPATF
jgi:dTDP-glucose 4,6-dehydratase